MPARNPASIGTLTGLPGQAIAAVELVTLRSLAFVPSVEVADTASPSGMGYQRAATPARYPQIGKFYQAGGALIPLLVSVRIPESEQERFEDMLKHGDVSGIKEVFGPQCFAIVDGQHRLGGLMWAGDKDEEFNPKVPLVLFFGLTYEEEAQLFDDVNSKQRGVPRSLREFTKGTITETSRETYDQKIRGIALDLIASEGSAWFGRVNVSGARGSDRKATLETLRRSTQEMFPREFLARVEEAEADPTELASVYWKAVSEACSRAWNSAPDIGPEGDLIPVNYKLNDLIGIGSVARLGKDVIGEALTRYDADDVPMHDTIVRLATKLEGVDWRADGAMSDVMAGRAGWAGVRAVYERLYLVTFTGNRRGRRKQAQAA